MSNQNWSCTIVNCNYSGAFNSAVTVAHVSVSSWVIHGKNLLAELYIKPIWLI